jgi:drug/metabolite transporter (DMT)-like permease
MPAELKPDERPRALAMLLLGNLFWGLSFPLIKAIGAAQAMVLPNSSTWFITASTLVPRFTLGTIILGALCFRSLKTLSTSEVRQAAGLGLFASAGMILQIDGLQFTSASTSAFLTQFYALMIPVWLAFRARRLPPWTVGASSLLVLAGVATLARLDWSDLKLGRGEAETLASSVFFMGQILWLDRREFAGNRALPVTVLMFGVEALAGLALAGFTATAPSQLLLPWTSLPWSMFTLTLTVFCTLAAFTLMNTWQPKITATEAGLLYCVEPVFASVMALFLPAWFSAWGGFDYPNETASTNLLVGGGLITAANVLIQLKPLPKALPPPVTGNS